MPKSLIQINNGGVTFDGVKIKGTVTVHSEME